MRISEMQQHAFDNATVKGFHDNPREFGTLIALIHSELSEALEAHRIIAPYDFGESWGDVTEELADVLIRVGDLCGEFGLDLEAAVKAKMEKNSTRPRLHGKKY